MKVHFHISRVTFKKASLTGTVQFSHLTSPEARCGTLKLFDSLQEAKQFASLASQTQKIPEGISVFGRLERIELSISAPQTEVLPLNYSRHFFSEEH